MGLLVALLVPLSAAACAQDTSGHDAQATPRALAAIVLDHVPYEPTVAYDAHESGKIAAGLRFRGRGGTPDTVVVSVGRLDPEVAQLLRTTCTDCDETELEDGSTLQVSVGDDRPGLARSTTTSVTLRRFDGEVVSTVEYDGEPIRIGGRAPRGRLDVETLKDILVDPNFGLTTVQGVVDDGDRIAVWDDHPDLAH